MKIYLIKKFETNTCGMYAWEPWKIVDDYNLILREIKNDIIDKREKLNITLSNDFKRLIIVKKVIPDHVSYLCAPGHSAIEMAPCDWPLYTYIVSEMEVITE